MAPQPPSIAHMKNSPNGAMKNSTYTEFHSFDSTATNSTATTQASFEDLTEPRPWTDSAETPLPWDRESSEDLSKAMEDFAELVMPSSMMRQQHVQSVPMLKQGFPRKNEDNAFLRGYRYYASGFDVMLDMLNGG